MKNTKFIGCTVLFLVVLLALPAFVSGKDKEEEVKFVLKNNIVQMPQVAPARAGGGMQLGLRLYGGAGSLFGTNNVNDAYEGFNEFFEDEEIYYRDYWLYSTDSLDTLEPLKTAVFGGMEIYFYPIEYVGFGIGFQYLRAKKVSGPVGFTGDWWGYALEQEVEVTQEVTATPILFNVYGGFPLGFVSISPFVGFGVYPGNVSLIWDETGLSEEWWWDYEYAEEFAGKPKTGFGVQGGVYIDFNFHKNFGMFIGFGASAVTFTDIEGDVEWDWDDYWWGSASGTRRNVTLDYGDQKYWWSTIKQYNWLFYDGMYPIGDWWGWDMDNEPAKISLSRFWFALGIKITFMGGR